MTVRLRIPFSIEAAGSVSNVLVLAGMTGIGAFVWSRTDAWVYQTVQTAHFEESRQSAPPPATVTIAAERAKAKRLRWLAPDPHVLGELRLERLGVRAMIREGTDPPTLRKAIGHLSGSAPPGRPGNSVLAAHRDTVFRPMRGVERGDTIRLRLPNRSIDYVVDSLAVVEPDAVEVMRQTAETRLTLITCFPFDYVGPSPRRFVIGARAIEPR